MGMVSPSTFVESIIHIIAIHSAYIRHFRCREMKTFMPDGDMVGVCLVQQMQDGGNLAWVYSWCTPTNRKCHVNIATRRQSKSLAGKEKGLSMLQHVPAVITMNRGSIALGWYSFLMIDC